MGAAQEAIVAEDAGEMVAVVAVDDTGDACDDLMPDQYKAQAKAL